MGVTNNLIRRVAEHNQKVVDGFTKKYNLVHLVFLEIYEDVKEAILRGKQIKAGSRRRKIALIEGMNPDWNDLSDSF